MSKLFDFLEVPKAHNNELNGYVKENCDHVENCFAKNFLAYSYCVLRTSLGLEISAYLRPFHLCQTKNEKIEKEKIVCFFFLSLQLLYKNNFHMT